VGGWREIEIKANSAQLKLELGLSLAIERGMNLGKVREAAKKSLVAFQ
jgi:hypothetical protein